MLKTIGISPKVKLPSIALAAVGALVVIAGVLTNQTPVISAGSALVVASGITLSVGYSAPPGQLGVVDQVKPIDPTAVLRALEALEPKALKLSSQVGTLLTPGSDQPPATISASPAPGGSESVGAPGQVTA